MYYYATYIQLMPCARHAILSGQQFEPNKLYYGLITNFNFFFSQNNSLTNRIEINDLWLLGM